jgi:DNA modification methylase
MIKLYRGDCLKILKRIPDRSVDAVVTDPPYGVGLTRKSNDFRGSRYFDGGESLQASRTYDDSEESARELISAVMPEILRVSRRAAIFCGHRMLFDYPKPTSIGCAFVPNGAGRDRWGFGCFNPILYYGKCPYLASGRGSRPNAFANCQPGEKGIDHPCPKPLAWMRWLVERSSLEGETVLDPFMGSGTTGLACQQLGRNFIGIEIDPEYHAIARRRIRAAQKLEPVTA